MAEHTSNEYRVAEQLHAAYQDAGDWRRRRPQKFTVRDIVDIKRLISQRVTSRAIANRFNVPLATISGIRKGSSWSHIPTPPFVDLSLPSEVWRDVVGHEGRYSVSNLGRVRRDAPGGCSTPGRLLRPSPDAYGYLCVSISSNGGVKRPKVHQLVAQAFIGPCPEGMEVNHKRADKLNNTPENLEYTTHQQNIRHALKHKLRGPYIGMKGQESPSAIFVDDDVREIKRRLRQGERVTALAREYGVHHVTISDIKSGRNWSHVK